jgi:hypothetical protein
LLGHHDPPTKAPRGLGHPTSPPTLARRRGITPRPFGVVGRPASTSGGLLHGNGAHGRGDRRRKDARFGYALLTSGDSPEDRAHHWLLFWLWPRDRAPLSRAGLERGCHHAHAARRRSAPVGTAPRAGARRDEARAHGGDTRGEWAHRRARQQRGHRALRRLRGHADGHGARGVRDQHLWRNGGDAGGAAPAPLRGGRVWW